MLWIPVVTHLKNKYQGLIIIAVAAYNGLKDCFSGRLYIIFAAIAAHFPAKSSAWITIDGGSCRTMSRLKYKKMQL